jgi:ankyrin repeat protein
MDGYIIKHINIHKQFIFIVILMSGSLLFSKNTGAVMVHNSIFSNSTMQLLDGLMRENLLAVSTALNAKANINEIGKYGTTPLIYSVIKGNPLVVAALLKLGADPNIYKNDGYNALTAAYKLLGTFPLMIETLINSGQCDLNVLMPDGEPMLYYLAAGSKLDLFKKALKKGANPHLRTRG